MTFKRKESKHILIEGEYKYAKVVVYDEKGKEIDSVEVK